MSTAVRTPAVAGRFYPGDRETLLRTLDSFLGEDSLPVHAIGCIAPHAGYIYSGGVAGAVYTHVVIPQQCIVLCPNHTGMGPSLSIMSSGTWQTPLGEVSIDAGLAEGLKSRMSQLTEDQSAHYREHAIEVQLPFLQVRQDSLSFVPIAVGTSRFEVMERLGMVLAEICSALPSSALIIASSDMNHYESDALTRMKDHLAIDRILELDARGLHDTVMKENISMCGFGPTVAMLTAANALGATKSELVQYATSGDVSGDRDRVVGYAGMVVW
jgi:AmmeMemoRadiSam system protein B